jgi:hypothetical protein
VSFVARLFRGEGLIADGAENPASEDAGYNNQRHAETRIMKKYFQEPGTVI